MNKTMSHSNSTLGKRNPNLPSGISDFTPARPNETNDINRPVGGMEPTRIPYWEILFFVCDFSNIYIYL